MWVWKMRVHLAIEPLNCSLGAILQVLSISCQLADVPQVKVVAIGPCLLHVLPKEIPFWLRDALSNQLGADEVDRLSVQTTVSRSSTPFFIARLRCSSGIWSLMIRRRHASLQ